MKKLKIVLFPAIIVIMLTITLAATFKTDAADAMRIATAEKINSIIYETNNEHCMDHIMDTWWAEFHENQKQGLSMEDADFEASKNTIKASDINECLTSKH